MEIASGIDSLTEKEKETLRLLVGGHDAKSIAREFNLSVHTINDRLRDSRRKLGVTSSREAARILVNTEKLDPNNVADKKIGVVDAANLDHRNYGNNGMSRILPWLGGGIFMLSLIAAAIFFTPLGSEQAQTSTASVDQTALTKADMRQAESFVAAQKWLTLVDDKNWQESWRMAGSIFRSQVSQKGWASTIVPVRKPLGALIKRSFGKVTKTTSLPGVPTGEYEVVEFQSRFANRNNVTETTVLAKEGKVWRVVGYFIR